MDICITCGGGGFSVAMIYCEKCQVCAVHRYCLGDIPPTFDQYVSWFCEDCEAKVVKPSTLGNPNPLPAEKTSSGMTPKTRKRRRKSINYSVRKKKNNNKRKNIADSLDKPEVHRPLEVHNGENHEEDQELPRNARPHEATCGDKAESLEIKTLSVATSDASNSLKHNCVGNGQASEDFGSSHKEFESVKPKTCLVAMNGHSNILELDHGERELGDGNSIQEGEPSKTKFSKVVNNDCLSIPECSYYVTAQPIIDPVWRGCFSLCQEKFGPLNGLVGHLSCLACPRACETARLLPELLSLNLFRRSDIWPKHFEKSGPGDESIAIFFFSNNERDGKVFDCLVDQMIRNDLAMKTVIGNVDLLLFTSFVLPTRLWRFQRTFYLWGVFRELQASSNQPDGDPGKKIVEQDASISKSEALLVH